VRITHRGAGEHECGVGADDLAGAELAIEHLLGLGHDRIVYATSASHVFPTDERRAGALNAVHKAGKGDDVLREITVEHLNVAHGRDAGERILGLRPRPTAVFCANDLVALGVLQVLIRHGVRVPDDMALVGFDDIEFAAAAAIPLTSVRLPRQLMGRTAADLLLEEAAGDPSHVHRRVVLQPELVVRASTIGNYRA
jgi:LacI family transcriptional regulator